MKTNEDPRRARTRRPLLALACALALGAPGPAACAEDEPPQAVFLRVVKARALHTQDAAVIGAVETLDRRGFFPELLTAAANLDLEAPAGERGELGWWGRWRMPHRIRALARSWAARNAEEGFTLTDHEITHVDWAEGRRFALVDARVELREGSLIGSIGGAFYRRCRLVLKIDTTTMDVVSWEWRGSCK